MQSWRNVKISKKHWYFFLFLNFTFVFNFPCHLWARDSEEHELGRAQLGDTQFVVAAELNSKAALPVNQMLVLKIEAVAFSALKKTTGENKSNAPDKIFKLHKFDAQMPEHKHGMVVVPQITQLDSTHWRVEGVKFHMKGFWQCALEIKSGEEKKILTFDLHL